MKQFLITVSLLFFISATSAAYPSEDMPLLNVNDLFAEPNYKHLKVAPSGDFISMVSNEDGITTIQLFNVETGETKPVSKFASHLRLDNYTWLNDKFVHLEISSNGGSSDYIGQLEYNDNGVKWINHELGNGTLVHTFDDGSEEILFSTSKKEIRKAGEKQRFTKTLYRLKIEDLIQYDFSNAIQIDVEPNNLLNYFYYPAKEFRDTNSGNIVKQAPLLLGIFYNEKAKQLRLSRKEVGARRWSLLFTINNAKDFLQPIDFIDAENLAVLSNHQTDKISVQRFNIPNQALEEVLYQHEQYDLTGASIGELGKLSTVVYQEAGLPKIEWLGDSSSDFSQRLLDTFENEIPVIIDQSIDKDKKLIFVGGPASPGKYYLYQQQTDKLEKLVSLYPSLEEMSFAYTEAYTIQTEDGVNLEAFITRPQGIDQNTLLVMPHGGPVGIRDDKSFNKEVQFLANRGFSVLRVNFRGSGGYGKAFQDSGRAQFGQLIEKDITLALNELLTRESYKNICAIGASYGGYSSMMLAIKHPETYDCVIASFGVYDIPLLFNYSNIGVTEEFQASVEAVVGENKAENVELSPVYIADNLQAPVLLLAGMKDEISGIEQSNRMRYVLKKLNKEFEYLFYKQAGHGHYNWGGDRHQAALTVDFIYRKLKLEYPETALNNEHSLAALAQDAITISDYFWNEKLITTTSSEKAFEYLQLAAELGEARAFFNIGAHYHRGDVVEKNLTTALEYYEKSADAGYKYAYERLGILNSSGMEFDRNYAKAIQYLEKAKEESPTLSVLNNLALSYCKAPAEISDVDECIEIFDSETDKGNIVKKDSNFRRVAANIIIENNFSDVEKLKFTQFVSDALRSPRVASSIDLVESGKYKKEDSKVFGRIGSFVKTDMSLTALSELAKHNKAYLGVEFEINTQDDFIASQHTVALVNWKALDKQGKLVSDYYYTAVGATARPYASYFEPDEYEKGMRYEVKIYNINGVLLYNEMFE